MMMVLFTGSGSHRRESHCPRSRRNQLIRLESTRRKGDYITPRMEQRQPLTNPECTQPCSVLHLIPNTIRKRLESQLDPPTIEGWAGAVSMQRGASSQMVTDTRTNAQNHTSTPARTPIRPPRSRTIAPSPHTPLPYARPLTWPPHK